MTPEAEQVLNDFPEFYKNALFSGLWDAAKFIAPFFAPAVLLLIVGTLAFSKRKINPILRIILIILSLLILAWMWIPFFK